MPGDRVSLMGFHSDVDCGKDTNNIRNEVFSAGRGNPRRLHPRSGDEI